MRSLLRWLGRAALVLYVFLVIVVLGARYWLLPHIEQWRESIAQALSVATDSQVQIGELSAQWQGLRPELQINDLQITDQSQQALHIPQITAELKWQSLFARQLQFSYLRIDDLHVDLWRDSNQKLHIMGQPAGASSESTELGVLEWLVKQDRIELKNAQLAWRDQSRDAQPLYINNMNGVLSFKDGKLAFNLAAKPQVELGQSLQLQGQLAYSESNPHEFDGVIHVQLNELSPTAWRHWFDLPTDLTQATLDTQLWLKIKQNQVDHVSMDTRIYNGVWQNPEWGQLKARSLHVFAASPWQGFQDFSHDTPLAQRLQTGSFQFEVYGEDVHWDHPSVLAHPLQMDELVLVTERSTEEHEGTVHLKEFLLKNSDVQANFQGTWTPKTRDLMLGEFDVTGSLKEVQLNRLYRYFPTPEISEEVVSWLQRGLVQGLVPEAAVRLQGNLNNFPYHNQPSSGLFYIGGPFINAEIDYYQPDADELGWPKVEQATGHLAWLGNSLWVNADKALLRPNGTDPVAAEQVRVHIDNVDAEEPILRIQGQTQGPAQAYLGLMTHSDLGALLGQVFEQSTATGDWHIPLDLRINLEDENDIQVEGNIDFANNTVQILPFIPPLEQVKGRLYFTETGARADDLSAQWLGGPIAIKNEIGLAGQALQIQGQAQAKAMAKDINQAVLSRWLQGDFAYTVQVGFDEKDQFYVQGESDLTGLASTFPAPLDKATDTPMPLTFSWRALNEDRHVLELELAHKLQMRLVESSAEKVLFSHGSLSWQQPLPELPSEPHGFAIDIKQDHLDLDAWQQVNEALQASSASDELSEASLLGLKDLTRLRLKSDQLILWDSPLDQLTYTMQQDPNQRWRADISAKQIAGTVQWLTDNDGEIVGNMEAKLQRLHWAPTPSTPTELPFNELAEFDLDLPNLTLTIDDLRWKEWRLGRLHLEGKQHIDNATKWQIPALLLHTPHGDLSATGLWQLAGENRGLKLSAQLQSDQAGELLSYIGISEVLAEGKGSIQAQVQWHNFPWSTQLENVEATVDLDLHEGRIDKINSRAAKVLEFLSLQSLSRLARLDLDIRGLLKNGFPFDDMKGNLSLNHNLLSTNNFRVVGPAGTIVIEGATDVETEHLDLRAVVVPNVDMSGAAIAAGIALNPVIGVGAFVTQLLFKDPLAKAMTVQYQLTGPWDQFETEEIKLKSPEPVVEEN